MSKQSKPIRIDADNLKQLNAMIKAMKMKSTLPTLVNFILTKHGIPMFIESELYRDAIK